MSLHLFKNKIEHNIVLQKIHILVGKYNKVAISESESLN